MPISVVCDQCGKQHRLSDDAAGKAFRCRECRAGLTVPLPSKAETKDSRSKKKPSARAERDEVEDDDDDDDDRVLQRRRKSPGRKPKKKKKQSSQSVYLLVIGVVILGGMLLIGFSLVTPSKQAQPATAASMLELPSDEPWPENEKWKTEARPKIVEEAIRNGKLVVCLRGFNLLTPGQFTEDKSYLILSERRIEGVAEPVGNDGALRPAGIERKDYGKTKMTWDVSGEQTEDNKISLRVKSIFEAENGTISTVSTEAYNVSVLLNRNGTRAVWAADGSRDINSLMRGTPAVTKKVIRANGRGIRLGGP